MQMVPTVTLTVIVVVVMTAPVTVVVNDIVIVTWIGRPDEAPSYGGRYIEVQPVFIMGLPPHLCSDHADRQVPILARPELWPRLRVKGKIPW